MMLLDDFARVTRRRPCPVCGKPNWCLVSKGSEPSKAICQRVESAHRWGDAGWLHDLHAHGDRPASPCGVRCLTWSEGTEEYEILLRFRHWTKHDKDRLYVAAVLPSGGVRELGNYDVVQGQWNTKGTTKDLSRERLAATKALVLGIVSTCTTGGES